MNNFSAFTPLAGGTLDTYYRDNEYPFDLNGALDYVRPATASAIHPYPLSIGHIEGLIPLFNNLEYQTMHGKAAFGPMIGGTAIAMDSIFPNVQGSMIKVRG